MSRSIAQWTVLAERWSGSAYTVISIAHFNEVDMNSVNRHGFLAQATSMFKQIRVRTWLMLGAAVLAFIGLLVWAGIAVLSWLWGHVATATDAGKRFAGEAMTQVEQVAPGLREQAEQWVPGVKEQAEQWLPAGAKEQAGKWLPGLGTDLPANDVSGSDAGPVSRFPGLVRSHFAREGQTVEVRYAGSASFEAVLAHYVEGFVAAAYAQEVMSATAEGERHRFSSGEETIELSLLRHLRGQVEVRLKLSSP